MKEEIERVLSESVTAIEPVAGGDINRAFRIETAAGLKFFFKTRSDATGAEFEDESAGLAWLAAAGGLPCPEPVGVVEHGSGAGLILEWIEPGTGIEWELLGRGLATIHASGGGRPGACPPGSDSGGVRFGALRLPAVEAGTAFTEVYAGRIAFLIGEARDRGALERQAAERLLALSGRLTQLLGEQPTARLHGDLWTGNVLTDADGRPWLIDPAAYGGDGEVDLAMLELFGSPPDEFYRAYEEIHPLREGLARRRSIWQLQPILVHAVLFGGHYGAAADRIARSFV
jgi:fructosamine-3-kinase